MMFRCFWTKHMFFSDDPFNSINTYVLLNQYIALQNSFIKEKSSQSINRTFNWSDNLIAIHIQPSAHGSGGKQKHMRDVLTRTVTEIIKTVKFLLQDIIVYVSKNFYRQELWVFQWALIAHL